MTPNQRARNSEAAAFTDSTSNQTVGDKVGEDQEATDADQNENISDDVADEENQRKSAV